MDAGPAKQRRRFTAAVRTLKMRLRLSPAQATALNTFWETDTAGGALSFTWVHPPTGQAATMRFIANQPPDLQPINRGMQYVASFNVEILP